MNDDPTIPTTGLHWPLRVLLTGACIVVILAGLKAIAPILSTFLVALLLAAVLSPLMLWLMRQGLSRALALLLTLLLVTCIGVVVTYMVVGSLTELRVRLPVYGAKLEELRDGLLVLLARFNIDPTALSHILDPAKAVGPAARVVRTIVSDVGHGLFILLITTFFLIEFAVLFRLVHETGRSPRNPLVRFVEMSEDVQKYMGINALVGLIGCVLYTILLKAMGVPFIPTWVVLYFFLGFIPAIGGVIAVVPVALLVLLEQGVQRMLIFLLIFVVFNFVNGDLIKPRILQGGFEMSIVTVFFSLVFWNFVLGPVGVLLAVPLTITVRRLYQEFAPDLHKALLH